MQHTRNLNPSHPNIFFLPYTVSLTPFMLDRLILSLQHATCNREVLCLPFSSTFTASSSAYRNLRTPEELDCIGFLCFEAFYAVERSLSTDRQTAHCTILHYTALHYTALHCTALYCTTLHCTALQ